MRIVEDVWIDDAGDTDDCHQALMDAGCSHSEAWRWLRRSQEAGILP